LLPLAVIDCHSLGIYTVIWLSLLSFSVKNDSVDPGYKMRRAAGGGVAALAIQRCAFFQFDGGARGCSPLAPPYNRHTVY
jgi:hypothetical protein